MKSWKCANLWTRNSLGAFQGTQPGTNPGMEAGDELQVLKDQAGFLEGSLKDIRTRIEELKGPPKKK